MCWKAIVIFGYVVVVISASADLDPCLSGNHRNISHINERYTDLKGDCPYTDNRIEHEWFYAGDGPIATFPPGLCACGYKFPIWMNGTLPSPDEGIVYRPVCLIFLSSCQTTFDIEIKNCGEYYVYHLTPGPSDSGYCFGAEKPGLLQTTPGQNVEHLPNATIAIQENSVTSRSFSTAVNISAGTDVNITTVILNQDGSLIHSVQTDKHSFIYEWKDLSPATNYTIQVYTYIAREKRILATSWIYTKHFRNASAKIEVQTASISGEKFDIRIRYDCGSENATAEGTLQLMNGTIVRSFQVGTALYSNSFKNLTVGTKYKIEIHVVRRDQVAVLDQVWVFTQPGIEARLQSDPSTKYTIFLCKFEPSPDPFYTVRWMVQRAERKFTIEKTVAGVQGIFELALTEPDLLKNHVHLPFYVSCAIAEKEKTVSQTEVSVSSDTLFAGIKLLTPKLSMHRDETKLIEFKPTIPFGCYSKHDSQTCNLTIHISTPVRENCTGISARTCRIEIQGDIRTESSLEIQATEDGQYGILEDRTYDVILRTTPLENSIWSNYALPTVKVIVKPETETYWRGKRCDALNDPHMYTFDAMSYEHHESIADEYILYSHANYPAKVHHKLEKCNTNAMCNCGVAVQAGRDIYLISTCNNMLEIGYKQCEDEVLLVKQETDSLYTIYLPYGTYIKARVDKTPYSNSVGSMIVSVSVYPSVHDTLGRSKGLCGTLDNDRSNDFHGREGESNLNRTEFIHAWRVSEDDSLFKGKVKSTTPWTRPACSCSLTNVKMSLNETCRHGADDSCSKGKTVGQQTCNFAEKQPLDNRNEQTLPVLDLSKDSNHGDSKIHDVTTTTNIPVSKTTVQPVHWNENKAKGFCTNYMQTSRAFRLCTRVPYTETERALRTCIQDIVLTQTTEWHRISRRSMQDSCLSEIHRNKTVREELERPRQTTLTRQTPSTTIRHRYSTTATPPGQQNGSVTTPSNDGGMKDSDLNILELVEEIQDIACPNECSDHGMCKNGTCKCENGYGGDDCSIDFKRPPITASLLYGDFCDEKDAECTHVFIYGGFFASETVRCHVTTFEIHASENGRQNMDAYVLPGQTQSLIEVICPLHPVRLKRSVPQSKTVKLISCYRVSVSNDGINHGTPLEMCVYNSDCQIVSNSSDGIFTAVIKPDFCFIDGKCIPVGTQNPSIGAYCEPEISLYSWAVRSTSTSLTVTTDTIVIAPVGASPAWKIPVIVAVACICAVCILVTTILCIRKRKCRGSASEKRTKGEGIVSYKHDPDFDEDAYAHINPVEISDDLQHVKTSEQDENVVTFYTRLGVNRKDNSEYDKLGTVDDKGRVKGPNLPERHEGQRLNSRSQEELGSGGPESDPYQKLNRSNQVEKDYEKLRKEPEYDRTPTFQLDVTGTSSSRQNMILNLQRDVEPPEGYEKPDPQYQSHYRY